MLPCFSQRKEILSAAGKSVALEVLKIPWAISEIFRRAPLQSYNELLVICKYIPYYLPFKQFPKHFWKESLLSEKYFWLA